jgi:hypothetical protein
VAAPPTEAVPLQALDPGAGRRARAALVVLAATRSLLAWQPWAARDDRAAAVVPVPARSPTSALATPTPTATLRPGWPPTPPPRPFAPVRVATLPESWGIAAYLERLAGEGGEGGPLSRDLLLKKVPTQASEFPVGDLTVGFRVCGVPDGHSDPSGARIESERVRVLGVTVPREAVRTRITVRRLGSDAFPVRQVAPRGRRLEAERLRPAHALFARPGYGAWPPGVYRFDMHFPGGAFRYLYACVIP